MKRSVGYGIVEKPEKVSDDDKKCPYYGSVSVRGKIFEGIVVSDSMRRTVKVERVSIIKQKKYNRYEKRSTHLLVHNPDCIGAKVGDRVLMGETRPLSKRKHFVVLKILEKVGEK